MKVKARKKEGEPIIINLVMLPAGTDALLGYNEVARALGVCRRTLCTMVAKGEYPSPEVTIGNKSKWTVATHNDWLRKRKEQESHGRGVPAKG